MVFHSSISAKADIDLYTTGELTYHYLQPATSGGSFDPNEYINHQVVLAPRTVGTLIQISLTRVARLDKANSNNLARRRWLQTPCKEHPMSVTASTAQTKPSTHPTPWEHFSVYSFALPSTTLHASNIRLRD